jgi:hypothetical protein
MLSDWILYPSLKNSRSHPTLHDSPHTSWLTLHSMSLPRTPSFLPALKYGVLSYALHVSTLHSMSLPTLHDSPHTPCLTPHSMTHSALHVSSPHTIFPPRTEVRGSELHTLCLRPALCVFAPHWSAGLFSLWKISFRVVIQKKCRSVRVGFVHLDMILKPYNNIFYLA